MSSAQIKQTGQDQSLEELKENIVLYHSGNTSGVRHLTRPSMDETLCGNVDVDYNQSGEINRTKVTEFKGRGRVLGRLCKICERALSDLEKECDKA